LDLHYFNDGSNPPDPQVQSRFLEWLENDLKEADLEENRELRPWIIIYGHKTIYCTNQKKSGDKCDTYYPLYQAVDSLLYKYNVDIFMGAHTHTFEVLKPVAFNKAYPVTIENDNTFRNAKAPMYVINGMSGTNTGRDDPNPDHPYLIYSSQHSSYSRLQVVDKMTLQLDFVHTPSGTIQRTFFYTKDSLRPFKENCRYR
jgi:acid phosphatase type 7